MKNGIIVFLFLVCTAVDAQEGILLDLEAVKERCDEIIQNLEENRTEEAFNILDTVGWRVDASDRTMLRTNTREMFNKIIENYGSIVGSSLVGEQNLGDAIFVRSYIIRFEYLGIIVKFGAYKGKGDRWMITRFKWNDQIYEGAGIDW